MLVCRVAPRTTGRSSHVFEMEFRSVRPLLKLQPLRAEYGSIWNEYSDHSTALSQFIHRIDKLEMAFQAKDYVHNGYSKAKLCEFIDSAHRTINGDKNDLISEVLQGLNAAKAN